MPQPAEVRKPHTASTSQQQQQQQQRNIKLGSTKPPPPSTKIPKSAVVMPDGTTSSSMMAALSLDVQFGIDLDTHRKYFLLVFIALCFHNKAYMCFLFV